MALMPGNPENDKEDKDDKAEVDADETVEDGNEESVDKEVAASEDVIVAKPPPMTLLVKPEDMRAWDFATWKECTDHLIAEHPVRSSAIISVFYSRSLVRHS